MKVNGFLDNNFIMSNNKVNSSSSTAENLFLDTLKSVSENENNYTQMKTEYINGERDDIQNILIEGQKVNLEISYLLQLRNNAVSAIKELMNISV